MSSNRGKPTVADSARREAKLLAKPTKLVLDPFGKTSVELKQPFPKELGEYAVIVIATPMTTVQFTIARPIGITDLGETAWVAHRSDQIQGMLARAKDPGQAHLDQSRTAFRQQLALKEGLLQEEDCQGKKRFFYPHRDDSDRNQLLEAARKQSKVATSQIKEQIASLNEDTKHEKQDLMVKLQRAEDPMSFLDPETSKAEAKLREFYQKPAVLEAVLKAHPQNYRTLCGPYFTVPQVQIPLSAGNRLEDVAVRFARDLAKGGTVPFVPKGGGAVTAGGKASEKAPPPAGGGPAVKQPTPTSPPKSAESAEEEEEESVDGSKKERRTILGRLTGKT